MPLFSKGLIQGHRISAEPKKPCLVGVMCWGDQDCRAGAFPSPSRQRVQLQQETGPLSVSSTPKAFTRTTRHFPAPRALPSNHGCSHESQQRGGGSGSPAPGDWTRLCPFTFLVTVTKPWS